MIRFRFAFLAVTFGLPTVCSAQVCLGLPSFSRGPVNIRATYESATGVKGYEAGVQAGGRSTFGGVSAEAVTYDGFDGTAIGASADLGIQIPLGDGKAALCPVIEGSLSSGPNGTGYTITGRSIDGGLAIGGNVGAGESLHLLPFGVISVVNGGATVKVDGFQESGTSTYGELRLGLGFLFGGTFAITPYIAIPLGLDNSTNTFGISASLAIGGRR